MGSGSCDRRVAGALVSRLPVGRSGRREPPDVAISHRAARAFGPTSFGGSDLERGRTPQEEGPPTKLYLIRHGPAAERSPQKWPDDDERPLTREGAKASARAIEGFTRHVDDVDRLFSSPARRARATAELLHEELAEPPALELVDWLAPGAPAVTALAQIKRTAARAGRVAIVGHEPQLGALVGLSVTGEAVSVVRLSKAGAASLEFPRALVPSGARLNWLLTRKQLMARGG
ncbi:MAG TPA: histidine phosphatase family protein [Thermoplasmata archaeon]|nr:histidine phosphatase family protein [Thermoplasmata archaeon]